MKARDRVQNHMSSTITTTLAPPAPLRKPTRWKRNLLIGLLVYTVVGFFIVPPIVKWQLQKQLPAYLHRQAVVKQVKVNPFALSLTVRGLSLTETNGAPFVGFDELYVNFQLSSLFRWAWTFSEVELAGPKATVVWFKNGRFNFSDLLTNSASSDKPFTLPPALVQHLSITNALLTVTDENPPTPFHTEYGPTHVEIRNLSTRPNETGPYSIEVKSDAGESFSWSGTVSLNPPGSRGAFELRNIPPAKYSPYAAYFTTLRVARGTLEVSANYDVALAGFPPQVEVSNLVVRLRDFEVKSPQADKTLLAVDEFSVEGGSASLTNATVRVPLVIQKGGSAFVLREPSGHLEVEKYVQVPTNAFVVIRQYAFRLQQALRVPLRAYLDELRVENFKVEAEDRSLPTPARLGLEQINVSVKGVSNQTNAPIAVTWDARWRDGGQIQVKSTGTLLPPASQADIVVSNLSLAPLQPYAEPRVNLALQSGALNVHGAARFDPVNTNTPLLTFQGDVSLTNFRSSDTITGQEFLDWENLGVRGIDFTLAPTQLGIDEVKFTGLRVNLVVSSNGQPSVLGLIKPPPASAGPANSSPAEPAAGGFKMPALELFPVKLGALVFEHGSLGADDESLTPRFKTRVEEFSGSVKDITFPGLARATVDLHGKVSALAPFAVTGSVTPDLTNPFVDLTVTFTNTDLTPFTPYSEKFAGYPLNKGKLAFDVHYLIENRAVKGENAVTVDQLTFGAHNQSPFATKLPVKLGVALLKDRNGRIALNVPVSGSLDDPKFKLGGVVWQVIVNTLVKAATSPFALLGALVGGGEEMQYVDFDPGSATLNDSQTNKLVKLTKALYERPALNLEIGATYDPQSDTDALGRQNLREKMKTLRLQEIVKRGRPAPPRDGLVLNDSDYERLLRAAYREAFNTTPEAALREALSGGSTNAPGSGPSAVSPTPTTSGLGKGAVALLQKSKSLAELQQQTQPTASGASSKPRTERELIRDELERRLMTTTPVTDAELVELMQRRAETVRKFMADTGVPADRLFLLTPKVDASALGKARAVFSLN